MKCFYSLKNLVVAACVAVAGAANAQTSHPLTFPMDAVTPATYIYSNNFYKDYVGLRFQVTAPSVIAGDKAYTATYDYTDTTLTSNWGGRPHNIIDSPVKFGLPADSNGCAAYPAGYFAGKIALVWRGTCEFGFKAVQAMNAGAIAVIIVNNVSGGPVGMAAGAVGAQDTIPTYMMSLNDGMDITAQLNAGVPVKMTILLNWGVGNHNDLGFVPGGYSTGAGSYAMPLAQLMAASHPAAYQNINGAFVANFGTHNATNVVLHSLLTFTPTGATTATPVYSDSVVYNNNAATPASPTPLVFRSSDSLVAMFGQPYNVPTVTSTGRFDLTYAITSDSADAFLGDNTYTSSFYATDSLYSKGRYDFTKNQPVSTFYTGPGGTPASTYIWGAPFFISNGGTVIKKVQFSVANGVGPLPAQQMNVYLFKWHDTLGATPDSLMENGEMELVGTGIRNFDGTLDSSFQAFTVNIGDTINGDGTQQVFLDANSWYVVAPEVPAGWAFGLDGVVNGYPRAYGLKHFHNVFEAYNPIFVGDRANNQLTTPNGVFSPIAFREVGVDVNQLTNTDSVVYSSQRHLLPSIAFTTSTHVSAVSNVKAPFAKINMYPNPATDNINVSISLDAVADQVTYTVINTAGQFITKEIHKNVQNEVYNYNTSNLPSGNYYIIVASGSKATSKKFTIIK